MEAVLELFNLWPLNLTGGWVAPVKLKAKPRTKESQKACDDTCDDNALIAFLAQGNRKAFSLLYNRYALAVLGYIRQMLGGNTALAEDISQDVWTKLTIAAPTYKENSFTAWLFTSARNTALNELRGQGRWKTNEFDEEKAPDNFDGDAENAEELLIRLAKNKELQKRIDSLPDRQRVALVAWIETDLSQKDLAEQLGMTFISLRALLFRAKKTLLGETDAEAAPVVNLTRRASK